MTLTKEHLLNKVSKSQFKYSSSSNSLESFTKQSYASQDSNSPRAATQLADLSFLTHGDISLKKQLSDLNYQQQMDDTTSAIAAYSRMADDNFSNSKTRQVKSSSTQVLKIKTVTTEQEECSKMYILPPSMCPHFDNN